MEAVLPQRLTVDAAYKKRSIEGGVRLFGHCVAESPGSSGLPHGDSGLDCVQEAVYRYVCSNGHEGTPIVDDKDDPKTIGELEDAMRSDGGLPMQCADCSATRGTAFLKCHGKILGVRCNGRSSKGELALLPQVRRATDNEVCALSGRPPADGRLLEFDACCHAISLESFVSCVQARVANPHGAGNGGRVAQSPVSGNFALTCPVDGARCALCRNSFVHEIHHYKMCGPATYEAIKSWALPSARRPLAPAPAPAPATAKLMDGQTAIAALTGGSRRNQNRWGDGLASPASGARSFFPDGYVPQKVVQQSILSFGASAAEVDGIMQRGRELETHLRAKGCSMIPQYISVIFAYTEESEAEIYLKLNRACRTLGEVAEQNLALYRDYLFHFNKAVTTVQNFAGLVYRAIDTKIDPVMYRAGSVVTWQQFSSTSRTQALLPQFLHSQGAVLSGTVFVITCSTGKDIRDFSAYPHEEEVLLTCNFCTRVLNRVEADHEKRTLLGSLAPYEISGVDVYVLEEFI